MSTRSICSSWFSVLRRIGLAVAALAVLGAMADTSPGLDISKWSGDLQFRTAWETITNGLALRNRHLLVVMMVFRQPGSFFLEYYLNEKGQEFDRRNNLPLGVGGTTSKELSDGDMKKIRQALAVLPEKNQAPPLNQLVILSHWNGTEWVTRTFDRANLPPAVAEIQRVIGERADAKL
jgi:hypothetical protein